MVVVKSFVVMATLFLSFSAWAVPKCTLGSELEPTVCSFEMPAIAKIKFDFNGAGKSDPNDPYGPCSKYLLNEKKVRHYFSKTKLVAPNVHHSVLLVSSCVAGGTMTLMDGRKAEWHIHKYGMGGLEIEGQHPLRLYCPECDFPQK